MDNFFCNQLLDFLPEYIFWKDVNSIYLGCNRKYAELLGFDSPEAIIGKTDVDLPWQPLGHEADIFRLADQQTMAGQPITHQEEILSFPNGKTLITLVSKRAIKNKQGKITGIVGYFSDITEQKQKEQELKKKAEVANQTKSAFIANMRHSLITPINGMIGMARIINDNAVGEEIKAAARQIIQSSDGLLDLINSIIEISRLESNMLPVYIIRFNLKNVVNNVIKLMMAAVAEKNLNLHLHYDKNLPCYFLSDATRIHRILLNLISNAIKFTDNGQIKLNLYGMTKADQTVIVKIEIQDTGIGIPQEQQAEIFTRFNRLTPSYQGKYEGSGLGLALVKQFIAELQGEIEVTSDPGKGTTFTCLLPLQAALIDEPRGKAMKNEKNKKDKKNKMTASQISSSATHQVLLVEDNKLAQLSLVHQLKPWRCQITMTESGETAVTLATQQPFDLIFMDIGLPGMDGIEATRQIRCIKKQKHTVIVALSAHIDKSKKKDCLAAGMNAVLNKPLSPEKCALIFNQLLRRQTLRIKS